MAATELTPVVVTTTGLDPTTLTAANVDGNYFSNLVTAATKTFFRVINGGGSPITVTIDSVTACSQGFDHNLAVVVSNGDESWIGPLDKSRFNDSSGNINVTYSAVTSVTVQVVQVP
jgi:hypothetical protein